MAKTFCPTALILLMLISSVSYADTDWLVKEGPLTVIRDGQKIVLNAGDNLLANDSVTCSDSCLISTEGSVIHCFKDASFTVYGGGILSPNSGELRISGFSCKIEYQGKTCFPEGDVLFSVFSDGEKKALAIAPIKGNALITESKTENGLSRSSFRTVSQGEFVSLADSAGIPVPKPIEENELLLNKIAAMPEFQNAPKIPTKKPKLALLESGKGESEVNTIGFDGTFSEGSVLTVPPGSVQTISVPGGKAVVTGPAKVSFKMVVRNGKSVPCLVVEDGKVEVTVDSGDGIVVDIGFISSYVTSGTFSCTRGPKGAEFSQISGSSTVSVTGNVKSKGFRASGSNLTVTYEDGTQETLANGAYPSKDNPSSFTLSGSCGFYFDETQTEGWVDKGGEERPVEPPKSPVGPDRGDVSPH